MPLEKALIWLKDCHILHLRPRNFIRTNKNKLQHESSAEEQETQDLGLQKISYASTQNLSSKVSEKCAKTETQNWSLNDTSLSTSRRPKQKSLFLTVLGIFYRKVDKPKDILIIFSQPL